MRHLEEDAGRLSRMRDSFESLLRAQAGGVTVHSGGTERIPNTSNLAFDGCTAEALMLLLEPAGLLCSAGLPYAAADAFPRADGHGIV